MPRTAIPGGLTIAYSEQGAGPPLVFLHGAVQTQAVWNAQVEFFSPHFRCVVYDLRGHGESELGRAPVTVPLLAEDLLALMHALGLSDAILCGVSLGGMIALHAAAKAPERVRAIVLANTPVALSLSPRLLRFYDLLNPYILLRPAFRALGTARAGRVGLSAARAVMSHGWVGDRAAEHFLRGFATMEPEALVQTYRAISEAGLPDLRQIRSPALIVSGEAETGMIFRHAAEIARRIGHAEIATIPGGHVTNLDAPDAFNGTVQGFFERWKLL